MLRRRGRAPLYTTDEEVAGLRSAATFNSQLLDHLRPHIKEGATTAAIDRLAEEYTRDHGHVPACLGYEVPDKPPYPNTICTSVNHVVCHGIPDEVPLKDGDIVNVDLTTIVDGWHGDQSETFMIGEVSAAAKRLVQVTFDAMWKGIRACRPGGRIRDIGDAIQTHAQNNGFSIVREYQGHGIGRAFHQDPDVPHFPTPATSRVMLRPGMCFTIEPMLNAGVWQTKTDRNDKWTVYTQDGALSAQFEHMVLIQEDGIEILTNVEGGPKEGETLVSVT
jgi:methionyl aminopeptidase